MGKSFRRNKFITMFSESTEFFVLQITSSLRVDINHGICKLILVKQVSRPKYFCLTKSGQTFLKENNHPLALIINRGQKDTRKRITAGAILDRVICSFSFCKQKSDN